MTNENETQPNEQKAREANEAIVELVREQKSVLDEKKDAMAEFKDRLDDIQSRMDGQLRVPDELLGRGSKQPELPFDKAPPPADTAQAQDGSVLAGEEAFAIANGEAVNEPEDADVIPLLPEHRESGSSLEFMDTGIPADDGTLPLDDDEIAMLTAGDDDDAMKHYQARTEASDEVAAGEIAAWRAAQRPVEVPVEKPKRSRRAKA